MNKKFVNFIIKRYLRFDKKHPFIYVSFVLAFLGILTGVATLMIAMGIMNGMDKEFETKLKIMNYPITVYSSLNKVTDSTLKLLKKRFPNFKYSPYLETSAIIKKNGLNGVLLYGVNFKKESEINSVFAKAVKNVKNPGPFDVIVGKNLFDDTGMYKDEKVIMIFSKFSPMGFGISPIIKKVKILNFIDNLLCNY